MEKFINSLFSSQLIDNFLIMCLLLSCDQKKNNLRFYEVFGVKLVELMKVCQRNCSNFSQGIFIVLWIAKNWKRRFLGRGILSNFTKTRKRTKRIDLVGFAKLQQRKFSYWYFYYWSIKFSKMEVGKFLIKILRKNLCYVKICIWEWLDLKRLV